VDSLNIAWHAEACVLAQGTVFIATAPYRQQVAALDALTPEAMVVQEGGTILQDSCGNRTSMSFVSLRRGFECIEVKPERSHGRCRSVLLTCRLGGETADRYLRRYAALEIHGRHHQPIEAGLIGTFGVPEPIESRIFGALPRGPLGFHDLEEALVRIIEELIPGWRPDAMVR
jgi:hypothetical protein